MQDMMTDMKVKNLFQSDKVCPFYQYQLITILLFYLLKGIFWYIKYIMNNYSNFISCKIILQMYK